MSEELSSQGHELGAKRSMTESESDLLILLFKEADRQGDASGIRSMCVQDMQDGGMGSLYFVNEKLTPSQRRMSNRIAELQFEDVDGVVVITSLNVDQNGDLFELDIWKTDFAPVVKLNLNCGSSGTQYKLG